MKYLVLAILFAPLVSLAQNGSLQLLLTGIGGFFDKVLIPFMLAVAFLIFVINVIRFFIIEGDNDDGQKNAKYLAFYSVSAFVFILSFWGLVNLLTSGVGFETNPCDNYTVSDYVDRGLDPCISINPPSRPKGLVPPVVNPTPPDPPTPPPATSTPPVLPTPEPDSPPILPSPEPLVPPNEPDTPPPPRPTPTVAEMSLLIREKATEFYTTKMPKLFGHNTELVARNLLADFYTNENKTISNEDRADAAYRLMQLRVIDAAIFNNYIKSLNQAEIDKGTPIRYIKDRLLLIMAKPLDDSIRTAIKISKAQTIESLRGIGATDDDITNLQAYDNTPQKTAEKLKDFEWFYNSTTASVHSYKTPADYDTGGVVRDRYIADINTEAIFSGNFNLVRAN